MSRGRDVLQRDLWLLPELGSCDLDAFARGTPQAARLPRLFRCGAADWADTGPMVAESLATATPSGRVRKIRVQRSGCGTLSTRGDESAAAASVDMPISEGTLGPAVDLHRRERGGRARRLRA